MHKRCAHVDWLTLRLADSTPALALVRLLSGAECGSDSPSLSVSLSASACAVSPDDGLKAFLHELAWTVTFSSAAGGIAVPRAADGAPTADAQAAAKAGAAFSSANRALVLDVLQRNLEVGALISAPSLPQVALVDVLFLVWTELEQMRKIAVAQLPAGTAAPAPDSDYAVARERFVGFVNALLPLKKQPPPTFANTSAEQASADDAPSAPAAVALLNVRALKETFQADLLDTLGIFAAAALSKQMVTTRTSAWYRQQKFNLLREESEGFAKLFAELATFFSLPSHSSDVELMQRKVFSFIGYFDLDPNRVIDVLFDAFERACSGAHGATAAAASNAPAGAPGQLGNFLALVDGFQPQHVLQILGFKFRNYYEQTLSGKSSNGNIGVAPQSLFDVAAMLVKTGRISLEGLYAHVSATHWWHAGSEAIGAVVRPTVSRYSLYFLRCCVVFCFFF